VSVESASRAGRKRSETTRLAILAATLELMREVGYAGLTVEGIAARSGAGKQTIYRWWPSKADVLLEALATKSDLHIPVPDTGEFERDLRMFLDASVALGRKPPILESLRALMAEAQVDPGFRRRFWDEFLQRRRDALTQILVRAQDRGELPVHLTPALACDLVFGVIWYRVLSYDRPLTHLTDDLVGVLTAS
jgi:AcrR family transcriptional regulator